MNSTLGHTRMSPQYPAVDEWPGTRESTPPSVPEDHPCFRGLIAELERINVQPEGTSAFGHPVHYMLDSLGKEEDKVAVDVLLGALHKKEHLAAYCRTIKIKDCSCSDGKDAGDMLAETYTEDADAVVLRLSCGAVSYRDSYNDRQLEKYEKTREKIEDICKAALKHRADTLTIFLLPPENSELRDIMKTHLCNMPFLEISEDRFTAAEARAVLLKLAEERGLPDDETLYATLRYAPDGHTRSELREHFCSWNENLLRTKVYTAYKDVTVIGNTNFSRVPPEESMRKLDRMIGLRRAKETIRSIVNCALMQRHLALNGISQPRPALHMSFTGSPGTAKTTVARLVAEIMRSHGLLSAGNLVEAGRGDLVGQYLGSTAPKTRQKVMDAKGSVLFIDEAYSLVDDREYSFGDEAISTLVQEMENNRDDLVVIFAGYPDKMADFFAGNPGLRSRVPFHVQFDDYSTEELLQILDHMVKAQSLRLAPGVRQKLRPIIDAARSAPDFGNGRYIRNLLEQARMRQATRLLAPGSGTPSTKQMTTLTAADFTAASAVSSAKDTRKAIGFLT